LKLRERVVPLCQFQSSSSGQIWNSGTSQTGQISCKAKEAWPGDALSCFAFSDDYSFGILQSGIHWSWFIAICSKLKGDFRYTPESVFDTFPWPQKPNHEDIKAVAEAAVTLRALRQETMRKLNYSLPPRAIFRLVFSV
jgi:hypothetical protein